jgi:hypothetical protein
MYCSRTLAMPLRNLLPPSVSLQDAQKSHKNVLFLFRSVKTSVLHTNLLSVNIYRNLRTQQMSVFVLLCTSYTTCFGPYWWPSSGGFVTKIRRQLLYVNGSVVSVC